MLNPQNLLIDRKIKSKFNNIRRFPRFFKKSNDAIKPKLLEELVRFSSIKEIYYTNIYRKAV